MSTAHDIAEIYKIIETRFGSGKARDHVANILHNLFYNLQVSNDEITAQQIESFLKKELELYKACAKNDVA